MIRLCALLLALLAAAPAQADTRTWRFRVFLDDSEIGHHSFTLREEGGARELRSEARFRVRLLGVSVYRYTHDATERWLGDCLQALASTTDDDGAREQVDWRAEPGGCALSFAYWNPRILQGGPLLNAQTGRFEPVAVTALGEQAIDLRGKPTPAQRYRLAGAGLAIDLWYAGAQWIALESLAKGGRRLRYRLI